MTRQPPEGLVASLRNRTLVPFVGAGMSMPSGGPSWRQLRDRMTASLDIDLGTSTLERRLSTALSSLDPSLLQDALVAVANQHDPLMVAQIFQTEVGRPGLVKMLTDSLEGMGGATASHEILCQLPVRCIVTTNYDDLLEQALSTAGTPFRHVVREEDVAYLDLSVLSLIKMHGSLRQPFLPDSVVFSRSDYEAYELKHPSLHVLLEFLISTGPVLFIGYSISDPNFRHLYNRVRFHLERHAQLHYFLTFDMPSEVQRYWHDYGIRPVVLSGTDRKAAVEEWLSALAAEI